MNGDRIGRWVFKAVFAVVPPALACLFFEMKGRTWCEALSETPEIGFTALMLSVILWSELREARKQIPKRTLEVGEYSFILLAVASAMFFGMHSKSLYLNSKETDFRAFLSNITTVLALVALVSGTIFQVLLAKVEG